MDDIFNYLCIDCGEFTDGYMLYDIIWEYIVDDTKVCLCLKCVEIRIGKPLQIHDFDPDKPINNALFFGYNIRKN